MVSRPAVCPRRTQANKAPPSSWRSTIRLSWEPRSSIKSATAPAVASQASAPVAVCRRTTLMRAAARAGL
eukprot:4220151-Lingulodinium_polyedra.AAC.1